MNTPHVEPVRHYAFETPSPVRRVEADDGCNLAVHLLKRGAGGATPVVFVHALAMDGRMWAAVAAALPERPDIGDLLAIDCRGHGLSDGSPTPPTSARFGDDIACVVAASGSTRAHVVGCSMGGTVALAFAARHPEQVASLSIIDSTAWYGAEAPASWEARAQKALAGGMQALTEFQRARWFSPAFLDAQPVLVQEAVDVFLANRVDSYVESCRLLGAADERAGLAACTAPVSVVVGEHDYATPVAMSEDLVARLPNARLVVIPNTRHYTPLEVPERIAELVADTLRDAA